MDKVDAVVIGAGAVGLAVGRALAMSGRETLILERESQIGTGISSRNSEVIHAGLYYPPGSLKARLCVEGRDRLYEHCASHGVAHRRCGKLIVATDDRQLTALRALERKGNANGVDDLVWLTREEARALEPELECRAALLSPSTGIVDSHGLMLSLQGGVEQHGGFVAFGSLVVRLERSADGWLLDVASDGTTTTLLSDVVVNAAGLWAPWVAARTTGLPAQGQPTASYSKGSYFSLAGASPFSRLIYPLPQDAWLGVHLTLDLAGAARFGPDSEWIHGVSDPSQLNYGVQLERAKGFYAEVRRYWPGLQDGALQPAYSGVRPKIHQQSEPAPDFRIDGPAEHGLAGLVNLFGIESPGLTSSLALAEEVVKRL